MTFIWICVRLQIYYIFIMIYNNLLLIENVKNQDPLVFTFIFLFWFLATRDKFKLGEREKNESQEKSYNSDIHLILSKNYSETLNNEYIGRSYQMSSWQFSMSFILYYVNLSICENKWIAMNMREQF